MKGIEIETVMATGLALGRLKSTEPVQQLEHELHFPSLRWPTFALGAGLGVVLDVASSAGDMEANAADGWMCWGVAVWC